MTKIESFKSFSQLQSQLREEARQKEIASKREAKVAQFNELLSKYNVASISDLNEEERESFMSELTAEGNAFGDAVRKAKEAGEDEFEFDGKKYKVTEAGEPGTKEMPEDEGEEGAKEVVDEKAPNLAKKLAPGATAAAADALGVPRGTGLDASLIDDEDGNGIPDDEEEDSEEEMDIEEGRAFVAAARKAKDEGKEEFEYNGKKYPVLLKEGKEITEILEASKREAMAVVKSYSTYVQKFPVFSKMSDVTMLWTIREILKAALTDANFHTEAAMLGKYVTPAKFENVEIAPMELGGKMYMKVPKKVIMDIVDLVSSNVANAAKWNGYAIIEGTIEYLSTVRPGKKSAEGLRAALAALEASR